jgi:glycosyltransferase involved in cell wall biosynthesis
MPTYNRRPFVGQAIEYFQRQSYSQKELIIVDDGEQTVEDLARPHWNVRYVSLPRRQSIGEKRNIALAASAGELIAHWDDDDWYDEHRLRYQIAPLLSGEADMTALQMSFLYDLASDRAWSVDEAVYRQMFFLGIHTGSICYRAPQGRDALSFPVMNLGEDVEFIRKAVRRGARLLRLPNDALFASLVAHAGDLDVAGDLPFMEVIARRCRGALPSPRRPVCIYLRHAANTWAFVCGEHLDPRAWHAIAPSDVLPASDLAYYRTLPRPLDVVPG